MSSMQDTRIGPITDALAIHLKWKWRAGKEGRRKLRGSCLFHGDPNPSADFYPDDGWYYCHACGVYSIDQVADGLGIKPVNDQAGYQLANGRRFIPRENAPQTGGLVVVRASSVQPKSVEWTWNQVLVRSAINFLCGIEGTGKSWLSLFIAAAVSQGWALPGEEEVDSEGRRIIDYRGDVRVTEPRRVLIFNCEDTAEHIIVPRLSALGADLGMIDIVKGVGSGQDFFSLLDDVKALDAQLARGKYELVIVDPIDSYMGDDKRVNTWKNAPVRSVLGPINELAERHRVCVLAVHHLNKGGKNVVALHRAMGSVAYTASARSVLFFGTDPSGEDPYARHCVVAKHNYADAPPPSMEFRLFNGKLSYARKTGMTADTLTSPVERRSEDVSAKDEAREWLKGQLEEGPREVAELQQSAKIDKVAWRTIERAKKDLRIKAGKIGMLEGWRWDWLDAPCYKIRESD